MQIVSEETFWKKVYGLKRKETDMKSNIRTDVAEKATRAHFEAQVDYICQAFQEAKPLPPAEKANVKRHETLGSYEPIVYKEESAIIPSGRTADIIVIRGIFIEEVALEALFRLRAKGLLYPEPFAVELIKTTSGMVKEIKFFVNLR